MANDNVEDMSRVMEQLLNDSDTLQRLAAAGKMAANRFAADKIVESYADLIGRVAAT